MKKVVITFSSLLAIMYSSISLGAISNSKEEFLVPTKPKIFSFENPLLEKKNRGTVISVGKNAVNLIPDPNDSKTVSSYAEVTAPAKTTKIATVSKSENFESQFADHSNDVISNSATKNDFAFSDNSYAAQFSDHSHDNEIGQVIKNKAYGHEFDNDNNSNNDSNYGKVEASRQYAKTHQVASVKYQPQSEIADAGQQANPFSKVFSRLKTGDYNQVAENQAPRVARPIISNKLEGTTTQNAFISQNTVKGDDLKDELYQSYISENKYIQPLTLQEASNAANKGVYKAISIRNPKTNILQIKMGFVENSSALSFSNVNNLRTFALTVLENPNQGVKIGISKQVMANEASKQLAAKRFSMINSVLSGEGIKEKLIVPVLTDRDEDSFSLNIFNNDDYSEFTTKGNTNIFGETTDKKSYSTMSW